MAGRDRAKRLIGSIYSAAAHKVYEPLVINGAFKLFGGNLNRLALEQGRRAVTDSGGEPILDMPVGTGYFTVPIAAAHGGLIVGADIAEGMVRATRAAAGRAGQANLAVVQADAHHLPFNDATFASIMCTNGLQVIPGLQPTLDELARVLRPGGGLFVSVLTLPVGSVLGPRARAKAPTALRSGSDVATAIATAGLEVTRVDTERLATLVEARKV